MSSDPIPVRDAASKQVTTAQPVPVETGPAAGKVSHPHSAASGKIRWILPLAALALGLAIAWLLVATRDVPEKREPVVPSPLVRVMAASPADRQLKVVAHGTVVPRTESDLVAEVRGRVLEVGPALVVGAFFDEGEVLLRLDDREHKIALDRARANVTLRESEARLASAEARRRRELERRGAASAADLEQFESRELVGRAALQEARASLEQARLDLERTVLKAPFAGRVRDRHVDVGQFVSPGTKLARVFAVDYAEVRLPIRMDDLAYLDAQLGTAASGAALAQTEVMLSGRLGGQTYTWPATLVRAEAAIDPETRMLHVVARVSDPFDRIPTPSEVEGEVNVPLPSGLFVRAEIAGRALEDVYELPLMALRDGNRIFIVDSDDRLDVRAVEVVRREAQTVIISGGLKPGERIVVSPLRFHSPGMQLRTVEAEAS